MKALKPITLVLTLSLLLMSAIESQAQVSNAAALFLRIAPGARAAAMGEAFVAVADDATATHWNPAGLGAAPLASGWLEASIPKEYRPIRGVAALRRGKGSSYHAYDLWLLTGKGLVRYDNSNWHSAELFETRTNQTVRKIVSSYLSLNDEEELDAIIDKIAQANFDVSYEKLSLIREAVLAGLPEDYRSAEELEINLDSLLICYHLCRLNYDRVQRLVEVFDDSYQDSLFSKREIERIDFSVERARTRFIPEDLKLPYESFFTGEVTTISSNGEVLLVGTTEGLFKYSGQRWSRLIAEDAPVKMSITTLESVRNIVLVGTTNGVYKFNGIRLSRLGADGSFPEGVVEAVGSRNGKSIYAVVGGDLYHYKGKTWVNSFPYTVQVNDSPEELAERFSIFGSDTERLAYLEKLRDFQPGGNAISSQDAESDSAASAETWFQPGAVIQVPFVASITGKVNTIHVGSSEEIWIGTEYGVLSFRENKWSTPGYREVTLEEGQTIEELAKKYQLTNSNSVATYVELLKAVNRIGETAPAAGTKLMIANNPAASATYDISQADGVTTYFATETGLLEYDGQEWSRSNLGGMGKAGAFQIVSLPDETWYVSEDKVATLGEGRLELTGTHVNWLPALADDLFYDFLSGVFTVNGVGTFGLSATFISFGTIQQTDAFGNALGSFESFDAAVSLSYGTSLTDKLKGGVSLKVIHSRLALDPVGAEKGKGTSTGFALDFGLLYHMSPRLNLGLAITNIGPKLAYIDAAQADDLPRNLAIGFAYKLIKSEFSQLLVTGEVNKILVGVDDGLSQEIKEAVFNGGIEFTYANLFALRGGYIYDQEGQIKTLTMGAGLRFFDLARADFSYIPNSSTQALANTLRLSLSVSP